MDFAFAYSLAIQVIALIMGIVYWQQQLDQRGVMNINGALFLLLTNMTFQNAMAVVNVWTTLSITLII